MLHRLAFASLPSLYLSLSPIQDAQTDAQVLHSQVMTTYNSKVDLYRRLDKTKQVRGEAVTELSFLGSLHVKP